MFGGYHNITKIETYSVSTDSNHTAHFNTFPLFQLLESPKGTRAKRIYTRMKKE